MEEARIWIARDLDGSLYLYNAKPSKYKEGFIPYDCDFMKIDKHSHPEITWENSPQLIEV